MIFNYIFYSITVSIILMSILLSINEFKSLKFIEKFDAILRKKLKIVEPIYKKDTDKDKNFRKWIGLFTSIFIAAGLILMLIGMVKGNNFYFLFISLLFLLIAFILFLVKEFQKVNLGLFDIFILMIAVAPYMAIIIWMIIHINPLILYHSEYLLIFIFLFFFSCLYIFIGTVKTMKYNNNFVLMIIAIFFYIEMYTLSSFILGTVMSVSLNNEDKPSVIYIIKVGLNNFISSPQYEINKEQSEDDLNIIFRDIEGKDNVNADLIQSIKKNMVTMKNGKRFENYKNELDLIIKNNNNVNEKLKDINKKTYLFSDYYRYTIWIYQYFGGKVWDYIMLSIAVAYLINYIDKSKPSDKAANLYVNEPSFKPNNLDYSINLDNDNYGKGALYEDISYIKENLIIELRNVYNRLDKLESKCNNPSKSNEYTIYNSIYDSITNIRKEILTEYVENSNCENLYYFHEEALLLADSITSLLNEADKHIDAYEGAKQLTEVSEQAKVLSLNASIEIARINQNNGGLKVIAEEIYQLAVKLQEIEQTTNLVLRNINNSLINISTETNVMLKRYDNNLNKFKIILTSKDEKIKNLNTIISKINNNIDNLKILLSKLNGNEK